MPFGSTAALLSLITLLPLSTEAPEATRETDLGQPVKLHKPVVSVPMLDWGGRPIVEARINGKGPFKLLLDTGTTYTAVLDDRLIKELGIRTEGEAPQPSSVGNGESVELETVIIGAAEFSKLNARRVDLRGYMPSGRGAHRGILGLPLFENCLLTLDYPGRKVILEPGELPPADGETIAYSPDKDCDYGITIDLSVAGTAVKAHLDSGSPGFVTLLNKWQDKLPLTGKSVVIGLARTPDGEAEIRLATLDGNVKIGAHEFVRPKIEFADLGPMMEYDSGNVGYSLLKDFAVTIDQKNRRLRLHRGGAGGE